MRIIVYAFLYLLFIPKTYTQAPSLDWANINNTPWPSTTMGLALDSNNNTLYAVGSRLNQCMFIKKIKTSNNSVIWEKCISSVPNDPQVQAWDAVYSHKGFILLTGSFINTIDFDPGPNVYSVTSSLPASFILKLDTSGNFVALKTIQGNNGVVSNSIQLDESGNIYNCGEYSGTIDFDPGPGIFNLTATNRSSFIFKLDSTGNFKWAKDMGVNGITGSLGRRTSIKYSRTGYIYMTGTKNTMVYVDKIDTLGNVIFDKIFWGGNSFGSSISVDNSDNIFITGSFRNTVDFDPNSGVYNLISNSGTNDIFCVKLSSIGNLIWAFSIGSNYSTRGDVGNYLYIDEIGNLYLTGEFTGITDFDPGATTISLTSLGSIDGFISKYSNNGNLIWVKGILGTTSSGEENGFVVITDKNNSVYTGGSSGGNTDLDPDAGLFLFPNPGGDFIQKLSLIDLPRLAGISDKCQNSQTAKAKLLNPLLGAIKTITLDGAPITFSQSDSSFTYFTNGTTNIGTHNISVTYSNPSTTLQKDTSYNVTATVTPLITINGNTVLTQGQTTTISSNITNGGTVPTYQWRDSTNSHNWQNIIGATNSTINYSPTFTGDKLACILTSNQQCVNPISTQSNSLVFTVNTITAIDPVRSNTFGIKVFPNPVLDFLIIDSIKLSDLWQTLEIFSIEGKEILKGKNISNQVRVIMDMRDLPTGLYFILMRRKYGFPALSEFIKLR